jgi:hypothetical protein
MKKVTTGENTAPNKQKTISGTGIFVEVEAYLKRTPAQRRG